MSKGIPWSSFFFSYAGAIGFGLVFLVVSILRNGLLKTDAGEPSLFLSIFMPCVLVAATGMFIGLAITKRREEAKSESETEVTQCQQSTSRP